MVTEFNPAASRVSAHGGHSGEFCSHARDSLEAVIRAYAAKGFAWAGISEHMPPTEAFLYAEERAAGLDAASVAARFRRYVETCRDLQARYRGEIPILFGFETEAFGGAFEIARRIAEEVRPDFIVGSVHHVRDRQVDGSADGYRLAADALGGVDALYGAYFDRQLEMIEALRPSVVGHFDLVRIFDPDYGKRKERTGIRERVRRNLLRIRELDLILDFNVRALSKGAKEPYPCRSILEQALELGISVVPGDDSHGVDSVGAHLDEGIRILQAMGFDTRWRRPRPPEFP